MNHFLIDITIKNGVCSEQRDLRQPTTKGAREVEHEHGYTKEENVGREFNRGGGGGGRGGEGVGRGGTSRRGFW
ncbi:UNVERIFIED_CONTAM: hypothetical protein Sangu_1179400 [Sesamum angustifolium]|uniref:Uncharacterized protein n=1 Tax=Sesamum angustifolium TaxID=2727405 RepID=A0AAW2NHN3_9LAMI